MPTEIDARITPTLHPDNVASIEGFDDQTAPYLAPTMTAFSTAYEGIRAVHEAREKAKTNPTWNEAHQIIHTDDFAQTRLAVPRAAKTARRNWRKNYRKMVPNWPASSRRQRLQATPAL